MNGRGIFFWCQIRCPMHFFKLLVFLLTNVHKNVWRVAAAVFYLISIWWKMTCLHSDFEARGGKTTHCAWRPTKKSMFAIFFAFCLHVLFFEEKLVNMCEKNFPIWIWSLLGDFNDRLTKFSVFAAFWRRKLRRMIFYHQNCQEAI